MQKARGDESVTCRLRQGLNPVPGRAPCTSSALEQGIGIWSPLRGASQYISFVKDGPFIEISSEIEFLEDDTDAF